MNTFLPHPAQSNALSLKVKGRLMPYEEFSARLKNFCASQGFREVKIRHLGSCSKPDGVAAEILRKSSGGDAVIILSCRVSYNPNWGGYSGLPQLRVREKDGNEVEQCPAAFIAPFLQQYRFAKEHIYLTATEQGRYLISVPESLLKKDGEKHGVKLMINLDKVAEPDHDGAIVPVMTAGSMYTYALSNTLRQILDGRNFTWKPGRSIPIDDYLGSELFSFIDTLQAVDRTSPFLPTLLPHLRRIVTHRTPHLLAAEIHLRQEFSRAIATFIADHRASFGNMLCLAGLDIDMSPFIGHDEHFFVPWKAYLERIGEDSGDFAFEQDDLFVRLMQQEKRCVV
jgi:hypothetical protein